MTFPKLENWTETAFGLHRGALLLGALQRLTQPPKPAYLELGLRLLPNGLAADALPGGGRVVLDFTTGSLVYSPAGGAVVDFPLNGSSQAQVFNGLFGLLAAGELAGALPAGDDLAGRVSEGIAFRGGRYRPPKREALWDETPVRINSQTSQDYLDSLQAIFTAIARFRAQLLGTMTPLVVWPEHFDLSTLWFVGTEIDESQPHFNFGYAPFSEGLEQPYLYAYAYPYPEHYDPPAMPEGTRWHTQGWTGAVLPYEVIAAQADPVAFVEQSCQAIYTSLLALL